MFPSMSLVLITPIQYVNTLHISILFLLRYMFKKPDKPIHQWEGFYGSPCIAHFSIYLFFPLLSSFHHGSCNVMVNQ